MSFSDDFSNSDIDTLDEGSFSEAPSIPASPYAPEISPPPSSINTDLVGVPFQNNNLLEYQPNLNRHYKKFTHDLTFCNRAVPLTFFLDYSKYSLYETSQKILVPKEILSKLTEYEDLTFPIYIKINDLDKIFGILDYVDFIEHIYIPTPLFYDLNLTENEDIIITVLKDPPPKATKLSLKPLSEEFYDLKDIKTYLEVWLKKMCITLHQGEIITLPYMNITISLFIEASEPSDIVSIHEIEEVEIDLLPMDEYKNKTKLDIKEEADESSQANSTPETALQTSQPCQDNSEQNVFVPFSGKGNRLGSS